MSSIVNPTLPAAPGSYATAATVRDLSGLSATTDVSNSELNELILNATLRFIGDVTAEVNGAIAEPDSTRTTFTLPHGLIADVTADAVVDSDDLTVRFVKIGSDGQILTASTGAVTVQDAKRGVFTTATAMPADYDCEVDYAHYFRPLMLPRAKDAVAYMSAHLAFIRMKSPGKLTRADLTGLGRTEPTEQNRADVWFQTRSRWLDLYRREVQRIVGTPIM